MLTIVTSYSHPLLLAKPRDKVTELTLSDKDTMLHDWRGDSVTGHGVTLPTIYTSYKCAFIWYPVLYILHAFENHD